MIESSHQSHDAALSAAPPTPPLVVAAANLDCHLLFIPDVQSPHWLLWGHDAVHSPLAALGVLTTQVIVDQQLKLRRVRGYRLSFLEGVLYLASIKQVELAQLPASVAVWSIATKLGLELVARKQIVPSIREQAGVQLARWCVVLSHIKDQQRFDRLAYAFPVAAHAVPRQEGLVAQMNEANTRIWSSSGLLREFLDALADQLIRAAHTRGSKPYSVYPSGLTVPWPMRWRAALVGDDAEFVPAGITERSVLVELHEWVRPVLAPVNRLRLLLDVAMPEPNQNDFQLSFTLQLIQQPEVVVTAKELFHQGGSAARRLDCEERQAQEQLIQMLSVAARCFGFIEAELRRSRPQSMQLKPRMVYELLQQVEVLEQAGVAVRLPTALQPENRIQLAMQMRIGAGYDVAKSQTQVRYYWHAELAGNVLSISDLNDLLEIRAPFVYFNQQWVQLNQRELLHAEKLLSKNESAEQCTLSFPLAVSLILTESITQPESGLRIQVIAEDGLADLVEHMHARDAIHELPSPIGLRAELRHYQSRGMSWLVQMTQLGLGACLADDMGLGKTLQWLAYLLHRRAMHEQDQRPVLLVCPTSVIGNWEREVARFVPDLLLLRHYGLERTQNAEDFQLGAAGKLVITSYGLLRRDFSWLKEVEFAVVALDEAQFIKNSASATARAARALRASERIALTGTPVENHLAELWSIMEFLNPGLLGKRETFRREMAIPIERYGREDVALRLRRMVAPFILRRVKSDPQVINDLPDKQESKVFCSLTREQISLYQHAVNASMLEIESADGLARRGRVLALLTALKQICNHPTHYLKEQGPLVGRSGKLDRLLEMIDQVLAVGDRALIFTQYREMGERLCRALSRLQKSSVPFLHGGVSRALREDMVRRFQEDSSSSRLLVVSLKAGGTGLNLTAATTVFHFDRWWNPAVEDQATDRAYRIGQQRNVQVYKMMCAGTVEEKIDQMLEAKRDLAARVVSQGEAWVTELDNQQLRELFALAPNAVVGDSAADSDVYIDEQDEWQDRAKNLKSESAKS